MALSLLLKFLGDSTDVKREAATLPAVGKKTGTDFGEQFGKQALSQIRAYIGAAAIARLISSSIKGSLTEGRRISAGAAKLKVTPEVFQAAEQKAAETGETIEEVIAGFGEQFARRHKKGFLEFEAAIADLMVRGKIISAREVENLKQWEIGAEDLIRKVRIGTAENLGAPPGVVFSKTGAQAAMAGGIIGQGGAGAFLLPEVMKNMADQVEKLVTVQQETNAILKEAF